MSCIAISTGLKSPSADFFYLKEVDSQKRLVQLLNEFSLKSSKGVVVVDGKTLSTAFQENQKFFLDVVGQAQAVICCRCSPTQKAEVVKAVRMLTGKLALSVGDGGNDVPMILEADIGVGILGKEGQQAALAADFSLAKFKSLRELILWHGRNSYRRGAVMAQFVIHRGLIISIMQAWYLLLIDFLPDMLFNGYLTLGYSTLFTMLPVFALVSDQDVDRETALKYPILYRQLQRGREISPKSFLVWILMSFYQAGVIIVLILASQKGPTKLLVTTSFTSLIFTQFLNILTSISRVNFIILVTLSASGISYLICLIIIPDFLGIFPFSIGLVAQSLLISLVSFAPAILLQKIIRHFDPTEEMKIMKRAKIKQKNILLKIWDRIVSG